MPPDPVGEPAEERQSFFPPATAVIVCVVIFFVMVQELDPRWLGLAGRDPAKLAAGEWWRPVTALFAYDDGIEQRFAIVLGALFAGLLAEQRYGAVPWLIIAFVSGLAGQLIALSWQPVGAGSSVAIAGLFGAVAAWLAWPASGVPPFARFGAAAIALLAVVLIAMGDIHGPPIVVGAALGALFLWRGAD
jgi:rhomboid protease GluP